MESEQRDSVRELKPAHNLNKQINKQLVNILIKLSTKVFIAVMILNYKRLKLLNSISDISLLNECAN